MTKKQTQLDRAIELLEQDIETLRRQKDMLNQKIDALVNAQERLHTAQVTRAATTRVARAVRPKVETLTQAG